MWIFMSDSFLSIVAHRDDPELLVVRARSEGDIEQVFPAAKVLHTPFRDYAYRTFLPRPIVAEAMAAYTAGISYTNFKNSVKDHDRHRFYYGAYNAMLSIGSKLRRQSEPIPF